MGQSRGRVIIAGARDEVPFSVTSPTALPAIDVGGERHVSVHVTGQGTGSVIFFQGSNDGTNWIACNLVPVGGGAPATFTPATAGAIWHGAAPFRYFRLNITGISAGTTAGTIECFAHSVVPSVPISPNTGLINSTATTNATSVKTSATTLYALTASNNGAAAAFVKLFNKASAPSVGTDTPSLIVPIPASGIINLQFGPLGARYSTGLALSITNLIADLDTTAVALGQVKVDIDYV